MREEWRSEPRRSGEFIATLVPAEGDERYCVVTEMSDDGVRINAIGITVPDEFALHLIDHGFTQCYRVIWRNGHQVGAKLIGPVPSIEAYRAKIRDD